MKYALILRRDGTEKIIWFDASNETEAQTKVGKMIMEEWRERQETFPFTKEFPADAIFLREVWSYTGEQILAEKERQDLGKKEET